MGGSEEWSLEVCNDPHITFPQLFQDIPLRKMGSTYKPIKSEV